MAVRLPKGRRSAKIEPFDYAGVTLDEGFLLRQFDEVKNWNLSVPNDDLLKPMRQQAGLPAPGAVLGGWYGPNIGQIIGGLSRMYAVCGDPNCKAKVDTLINEYMKCLSPDGRGNFNETGHYSYDKMVGGLVDASLYCGNKQAITCLSRITDWAIQHLDRKNIIGDNGTEWYTLSENLFRAYLLTRNAKYLGFAEVWEYPDYWNMFKNHQDILSKKPLAGLNSEFFHAYSHVNTLCGAAMAYFVKDDPRYADIIRSAYDYFQDHQVMATGGFGPWLEHLLPRNLLAEAITGDRHDSTETQCNSWAIFKLCKYLLSITGDAKYAGWIEKAVYNMTGATIPLSGDGMVMYYSDYNSNGGTKKNNVDKWTCCTSTRLLNVADFADLIYFKSSTGIYVSLYSPSTAQHTIQGRLVSITQRTRFPEVTTSDLTFSVSKPTVFSVYLRVPDWLGQPMRVSVNGKAITVKNVKLGWLEIKREWRNGEAIHVDLPMSLRASRLDETKEYPTAIMYGPVAMAVRYFDGNPAMKIDLNALNTCFVRTPGEPLCFTHMTDSFMLLRPFYAFREGEPYTLYLNK